MKPSKYFKVYGPYPNQPEGRKRVIIIKHKGDKPFGTSYARYLMSLKLDRELEKDEHVDHIDNNCLNDDLDNLQILTPQANKIKSSYTWMGEYACPYCKKVFVKKVNAARGKTGPFCSRDHAYLARYTARNKPAIRLRVWRSSHSKTQ